MSTLEAINIKLGSKENQEMINTLCQHQRVNKMLTQGSVGILINN